jgi:hypothetical protein
VREIPNELLSTLTTEESGELGARAGGRDVPQPIEKNTTTVEHSIDFSRTSLSLSKIPLNPIENLKQIGFGGLPVKAQIRSD